MMIVFRDRSAMMFRVVLGLVAVSGVVAVAPAPAYVCGIYHEGVSWNNQSMLVQCPVGQSIASILNVYWGSYTTSNCTCNLNTPGTVAQSSGMCKLTGNANAGGGPYPCSSCAPGGNCGSSCSGVSNYVQTLGPTWPPAAACVGQPSCTLSHLWTCHPNGTDPCRGGRKFLLLEATCRPAAPAPVHWWTFSTGIAIDSGTAASQPAKLVGDAVISNGKLVVGSKGGGYMTSLLIDTVTIKTLVAWVALATVSQAGGSALTIESGATFDAIDYGELVQRQWMAGSDNFKRSPANNGGAPENSTSEVMMAIVYAVDNNITVYRDGVLYAGPYTQGTLQTYINGASNAVIGVRHTLCIFTCYLIASISEARIYDVALTQAQIQTLVPASRTQSPSPSRSSSRSSSPSVTPPFSTAPTPSGCTLWCVVGISVGGGVLLLVVTVTIAVVLCKRPRRTHGGLDVVQPLIQSVDRYD